MDQENTVKTNIENFYQSDLNRLKREIEGILDFYNDYEFVDKSDLMEIKDLLER